MLDEQAATLTPNCVGIAAALLAKVVSLEEERPSQPAPAAAKKKADEIAAAAAKAERERIEAERAKLRAEQEAFAAEEAARAKAAEDARIAAEEARSAEFFKSIPAWGDFLEDNALEYGVSCDTVIQWVLHYADTYRDAQANAPTLQDVVNS